MGGLLCFFNEKVDIELDGELQQRPTSPWSHWVKPGRPERGSGPDAGLARLHPPRRGVPIIRSQLIRTVARPAASVSASRFRSLSNELRPRW